MKYRIEMKSLTPIMFNKPISKEDQQKLVKILKARSLTEKEKKDLIEKKYYKNEKGEAVMPATIVKRVLMEAARFLSKPRMGNYKGEVENFVSVYPIEIILNAKGKPLVDERWGNQGGRKGSGIIFFRPRFNSWLLKFIVDFEDEFLPPEIMKKAIYMSGRIGLGAFHRNFGKAEITKLTEE